MRNLTFVDTLLFMNAMLSTNYRLELTDICCRMITTDGIEVTLDENKVPEKIFWSAPDGGINRKECKALLLSFWDSKNQETLKMDLWLRKCLLMT